MDAEANIFMVFTGFSSAITGPMEMEELALWNDKALERHKLANDSGNR